jgi:hypothetical protein
MDALLPDHLLPLRMRNKKIIGFSEINSYVEKSRTFALESTLLS